MQHAAPAWQAKLDEEDLQFIRRFVLASGSLKELAKQYSVSYPTLRARLDRLIQKIQAIEDPSPADDFERDIRVLVADGQLSPKLAKALVKSHHTSTQTGNAKKGHRK